MSLRQRRHQCANAVIIGLAIIDGLDVHSENWASVILSSCLIVFILVSRIWLDSIARKEQRALIRESVTTAYASVIPHLSPRPAQSAELFAQSDPAVRALPPRHEPRPQGHTS